MTFGILSKRILENGDIKRIVDGINSYEAIFTFDQRKELGFSQSDFNTQIRSIAKSLGIDTNDRSLMSVAKDVESALGISL